MPKLLQYELEFNLQAFPFRPGNGTRDGLFYPIEHRAGLLAGYLYHLRIYYCEEM